MYNLICLIEFNPTIVWGTITAPVVVYVSDTLLLELEYGGADDGSCSERQ